MIAVDMLILEIIGKVENFFKPMDKVNKALNDAVDNTDKASKATARFDMRLLSLLFGGMALKRLFGGMLRSITNTFLKAEDNTSGLSQATTRLHAAWEFLKFSIFDALDTDLFIKFLDWIVGVINWFSQLDRKWKITFLAISAGFVALGTFMMAFAQIKLLWDAIFGIGGFLASKSTVMTGLGEVDTKIKALAGIASITIGIALGVSALKEGEFDDMLKKAILAGIGVGVGAAILTGSIATGLVLAIAITALITFTWQFFGGADEAEKAREAIKQKLNIPQEGLEESKGFIDSIWGSITSFYSDFSDKMDNIALIQNTTLAPSVENTATQFDKKLTPAINGTSTEVNNLTNKEIPPYVATVNNTVIPANNDAADSYHKQAEGVRDLTSAIRELNAARSEASSSESEEEDITTTSSVK